MISNWAKGSSLVLFGAFLWGTLVVFTKGAAHLEPTTVAVVRGALSTGACFLWLGITKPHILKIESRMFFPLFFCGLPAACMYMGFTIALKTLSVATCEIIFFTFPLFTTVLGIFILKERPTALQVVACFLILAGVVCMTVLPEGHSEGDTPPSVVGFIGATLSMSGMTAQSLIGRRNAQKNWLSTETLFAYTQLFAFFWMVPYKALTAGWGDLPDILPASWLLMAYMGIIATFLAYGAYNLGLRYIHASTASMLASFEMVTAVTLAAAALGTWPTAGELVGCIVILTALVLSSQSARKQSACS